jgi:hypothetical protein
MRQRVVAVNQVRGGLVVTFDDETSVFFDAVFLHDHRNDEHNGVLPAEKDGSKIG